MKSKLLIIFIFISFFSYSQSDIGIDIRVIAKKIGVSKVQVNKIDKMDLFGIIKEKIDNSNTNLYYYHSAQGSGQNKVYLDKNNIDLFLNKDGIINIIYDAGSKAKITSTRNYYHSIEIDNKNKTANFNDLYEENKLSFKTPNLISIYNFKGLDETNLYRYSEILINIDPPFYFFRTYYEIPRIDISGSKYDYNIELVFPNSFLDLYKLLSFDLKNNTLTAKILNGIDESMNQEISDVPSLAQKGEFETTEEYNKRISEGQIQKQHIEEKYQKLISDFNALAENDKREKIQYSLKLVNLEINNIGNYDADKQEYSLTINGITDNIKIPISEAKSLKENYKKTIVTGYKKLKDDGETYEIFNIKIIHPITNTEYLFGIQKKLSN